MVDAINEAIIEEMDRDSRVITWGEDVGLNGGPFGATVMARDKYFDMDPKKSRVLDTAISEAYIVGSAVGAAIAGMRPVVEIGFIDFNTCAMDDIINQMAKLRYMSGGKVKVPMVFRTTCGADGQNAAQHSQSLEGIFLHIPGIKVVMPSNPADAKGLLKSAIRDDDPVIVVEPRAYYSKRGEVPVGEYLVPLGVASVVREGTDVTVIATCKQVAKAVEAAEILEKEGISLEIIDPRTLFPLDMDTIMNSLKKTGRLVVTEEAVGRGGFGADLIARVCCTDYNILKTAPARVASLETPIPFCYVMENYYLPQTVDIVNCIRGMMNR